VCSPILGCSRLPFQIGSAAKQRPAMQLIPRGAAGAVAAIAAALTVPRLEAIQFEDVVAGSSPVYKVTDLVAKLEANLISDGKVEQQRYDKYMCWCEDALSRKAKDIADAKDTLEKLAQSIPKTGAEVASHSAEIGQLKKDVQANQESQREATDVRGNENSAYETAKAESENSIGALEAAVTAVTGAGTKKGFLETMKQAQLISVAAGMKQVIARDSTIKKASAEDMETLRQFVQQPADFLGSGADKRASALQTAGQSQDEHPFGDYAPQSSQIQGILKGLYDGFVADMEKDHGVEAEKQKAFEEFMATKGKELSDLQSALEQHQGDMSRKAKFLADSKEERDDTEAQLKADKSFVEESKDGCQRKAQEWSERSRMRTEEILGIQEALKILRDPENQAIFSKAATNFMQLSSNSFSAGSTVASAVQKQRSQQRRALAMQGIRRAYSQLSALARKLGSLSLARIAAQTREGGHFDKVMTTIDTRVADLRKQEQEDIEHRDRCENSGSKSENDLEDLTHASSKAENEIERLGGTINDLDQKVLDLEGQIKETDLELANLLKLRNDEVKEFKQALKDDTMAAQILKSAIVAMAKFYKKNNVAMSLLQGPEEWTVDSDKAPKTGYDSSGTYTGGHKSQSRGALGALEMVVEDMENEVKVAKKDDADAEAQYEESKADLDVVREKAEKAKVEAEKRAADLKNKKEDKEELKTSIGHELEAQNKLKNSISNDCAWVKSHFESRRSDRKAEIDGLQEAKALLAGADQGDYDELALDGGSE